MVNIPDIPFNGRFYAKLEALLLDDLGSRTPEGHGEALLVFDGTVPYLYLPNDDASDWLKFALIDVTAGEPTDGYVAKWDATAHQIIFEAEAGATPALIDLTDVDATPAPANGDAPVWDEISGKFVFAPVQGSLLTLSDVDSDPGPTDGQYPAWDDATDKFVFVSPSGGGGTLAYAKVQKTGLDAINSGATETLTWDVELMDTLGGFDLGTNATIFTAPATGVYLVNVSINGYCHSDDSSVNVWVIPNSVGGVAFIMNESVAAGAGGQIVTLTGSHIFALTAADTVKVNVSANGTNFDPTAGECYFEIVRLA